MFYILMNHVELTQEQFYSLLCGNKTTSAQSPHKFSLKTLRRKTEAIAAKTFEGDPFYFMKSENRCQPKPDGFSVDGR